MRRPAWWIKFCFRRSGRKNGNKGFSLLEVLMSLAVGSIIVSAIFQYVTSLQKGLRQTDVKHSLLKLSQEVYSALDNPLVWQETVDDAANAALACRRNKTDCCVPAGNPACTQQSGAFQLRNYDGLTQPMVYNTTANPTRGFTYEGLPCNQYSAATGSEACPIQISLTWTALCPGGGGQVCMNPKDKIDVSFSYSTNQVQKGINLSGFSFTKVRRVTLAGSERPPGTCSMNYVAGFPPEVTFTGNDTKTVDLTQSTSAKCIKVRCASTLNDIVSGEPRRTQLLITFRQNGQTLLEYVHCKMTLDTPPAVTQGGFGRSFDFVLPIPSAADEIVLASSLNNAASITGGYVLLE